MATTSADFLHALSAIENTIMMIPPARCWRTPRPRMSVDLRLPKPEPRENLVRCSGENSLGARETFVIERLITREGTVANQTSPERGKTAEEMRLDEAREKGVPWKQWGPYLSERQWGTVREDYSENGDAWNYFTHDQARSRAYHWGEDGLAGFSDDHQRLCFALALWNGKDPILKERLFGLTNSEGNHGEDVKEYYFYLDSTPTHSYMKYLYKYPQHAYPYGDLIETNRRRGRDDWEYELLDTGIFNEDRYFDVFVEYAKASPTDILIQISVANRGPEAASIHVLPTLWFRNTWTWWPDQPKPSLRQMPGQNTVTIETSHAELGGFLLHCDGNPRLLVYRKRHQQRADLRHTQRATLCQGRDQQLCRGGSSRTPSTRTRPGPRPPRTISSMSAPGKPPSSG